jgi:tRNA-specific 2-thiouridylase
MNYMAVERFEEGQKLTAKIRYSHKGAECVIESCGQDTVSVRFLEQVRAVTPGQAVVFYENGMVMGGGVIC